MRDHRTAAMQECSKSWRGRKRAPNLTRKSAMRQESRGGAEGRVGEAQIRRARAMERMRNLMQAKSKDGGMGRNGVSEN